MSIRPRIIPVLLLSEGYLVKPTKFQHPKYIGDPINAVRIFNEKEVDELIICDIDASLKNKPIDFKHLNEIVSEAFMPIGYGGGVKTLEDAKKIVKLGVEKVVVNSAVLETPNLISAISQELGSQSTVVSIDAKKKTFGKYEVMSHSGTRATGKSPNIWAKEAEKLGAGEIILSAIDKESTRTGYDYGLVESVAKDLTIPLVALGGAGNIEDLDKVLAVGASAASAGTMFVMNGPHRAVLITYPKQ